MEFGPLPLDDAVGKLLGHNVTGSDGRRLLRKGRVLTPEDIAKLKNIGRNSVYVAILNENDVVEDEAARQIANAISESDFRHSSGSTGRVNIYATELGLVRINQRRLVGINRVDGVTLATLKTNTPVRAGRMIATLKIIPYAIPNRAVIQATQGGGVLGFTPLKAKKVGMILSGSISAENRIVNSFQNALGPRIEALGSKIEQVDFVPLDEINDEVNLSNTIQKQVADGAELIILAGETAIMDRYDLAPRAVDRSGGLVECYGAPVDPGNLLMLGYHGQTAICGAPGCSRSPKDNIVDLILPRLLAGDRVTHEDVIMMGHGGLLDDVPERPLPRSRLG